MGDKPVEVRVFSTAPSFRKSRQPSSRRAGPERRGGMTFRGLRLPPPVLTIPLTLPEGEGRGEGEPTSRHHRARTRPSTDLERSPAGFSWMPGSSPGMTTCVPSLAPTRARTKCIDDCRSFAGAAFCVLEGSYAILYEPIGGYLPNGCHQMSMNVHECPCPGKHANWLFCINAVVSTTYRYASGAWPAAAPAAACGLS